MRDMIMKIDPFFGQLIILPIIVIGLGVFVSALTKKVLIGPIVTLILNATFEIWFHNTLSSWNIIFPLITLFLSGFFYLVITSYVKAP